MLITIVGVRSYKFSDKKTGETITGNSYGGYIEDGSYIVFSSREGEYDTHDSQQGKGFKRDLAEDIELYRKFDIMSGKSKWTDTMPN